MSTFTPNSSFIEGSTLQLAWDSTSLGLFKTCPRKYYYTIIEEWRARRESIHLTFGILFHKALETYDRALFDGYPHHAAVREAVKIALHSTWIRTDTASYPWDSGDTKKSRFTLIRAIVWYFDQFSDDPCKTFKLANGRPAVELSFKLSIPFISPTGEDYILCGHLDRLVSFNDELWVLDRKTTGGALSLEYFHKYSPDNQISLYSFASKLVLERPTRGVIIDAVQLSPGFSRFQRGFVNRTPGQLEEWYRDLECTIRQAEVCAEQNYYPQNDTSCDKFGGCQFREVCGKDPKVRQNFLDTDFIRSQWNPLVSREV